MTSRFRLLIAASMIAGAAVAPVAAHADYRGYGGYRGGYYHRGFGVGGFVAGTLLGLGTAAVIGGALAPAYVVPPPVFYAPPRPVYYAPPPVYYAPPPAYYAPPGYYPR